MPFYQRLFAEVFLKNRPVGPIRVGIFMICMGREGGIVALLHIDNLVPGMVLSRDVCDRSGRMLLPAGAELAEKHFSIFRMWGVLEAEVVGDDPCEDETDLPREELDPVLLAAVRKEVEGLFVHNDRSHPAVKELIRICIHRRSTSAS